jgi:hypothetical protein
MLASNVLASDTLVLDAVVLADVVRYTHTPSVDRFTCSPTAYLALCFGVRDKGSCTILNDLEIC